MDLNLSLIFLSSLIILPLLNICGPKISGPTWLTKSLYYFLIPLWLILYLYGQTQAQFGLQWGNWQLGLLFLIGYVIIKVLITPYAVRQGWLDYYRPENLSQREKWRNYDPISLMFWEFFWRGYALFGLAQLLPSGSQEWSIVLQTIPFTLMHLGKPTGELLGCLPGGVLFGLVAWLTESSVWPGLIHAFQQFWTFYQLNNLDQLFQRY